MSDPSFNERLGRFLEGTWQGAKRVQGIQGGARAYALSLVAAQGRRSMLIGAGRAREAENLYDDLTFFRGEERALPPLRRRLHLFPSWEVLPFEKLSPHPENVAARLEGLYKLIEEPAPILIATPAALMQKVIPRDALKRSYLYLVAGQTLARETLLEHLVQWGYQNMPLVEERGDFSARGGIVDLFSPGYARPQRLEFDGDRLESVREFSPAHQRSERPQEDLLLLPMKEFSLRRSGVEDILRKLDQRAAELEMDRREKKSLLDGADRVEAEAEKFARLAWERHEKTKEERRLVSSLEAIYLNEHEWRGTLAPFAQVHGESLSIMASSERAQESTLTVESFLTSDVRQETHLQGREPSLAPLVERLRGWEGERGFFVAPTRGGAVRVRAVL